MSAARIWTAVGVRTTVCWSRQCGALACAAWWSTKTPTTLVPGSPGNLIRFSRRGPPQLHPSLASKNLIVRQFCCSDYDGGGDADDGLLVVASPAGGVLMAAIYERASAADRSVLR